MVERVSTNFSDSPRSVPDARINCWTAAYEADTLQIELVVNVFANMIGKNSRVKTVDLPQT